jgi:hypothetical protein
MTALEWILTFVLFSLYLVCIVTVCMVTFRKGYIVLGIAGIVLPVLWLIGAVLPAKKGSQQEVAESIRRERQVEQVTH